MPVAPLDRTDVAAALDAVTALAALDATAMQGSLDEEGSPGAGLHGHWSKLLSRPIEGLDTWSSRHLEGLAELESSWDIAVRGDSLVHGDLRTDNLLIAEGGPVVVDWPSAAVGAPFIDLLGLLPSLHLDGGPPPAEIFETHPIGVAADPRRGRHGPVGIRRISPTSLAATTAGPPDGPRVSGRPRRRRTALARRTSRLALTGRRGQRSRRGGRPREHRAGGRARMLRGEVEEGAAGGAGDVQRPCSEHGVVAVGETKGVGAGVVDRVVGEHLVAAKGERRLGDDAPASIARGEGAVHAMITSNSSARSASSIA